LPLLFLPVHEAFIDVKAANFKTLSKQTRESKASKLDKVNPAKPANLNLQTCQ
jgi:hypothetical protein